MTEDEMVGWHDRLNGHEFEQIPARQRSLVCCSPWGQKDSDMPELLNNSSSSKRNNSSTGFFVPFCNQYSNGLWPQSKTWLNQTMTPWHCLSSSDLTLAITRYRKPENIKSSCTSYIFPVGCCRKEQQWCQSLDLCLTSIPDKSLICFGRSPSVASSLTNLAPTSVGLNKVMAWKRPPQSSLPLPQPPAGSYSMSSNDL